MIQIFKDAKQGIKDLANIISPITKTMKLGFNSNGIGSLSEEEENEIIELLMIEEMMKSQTAQQQQIGMNPKTLLSNFKTNETLRHVSKLKKNSLQFILGHTESRLVIQDLDKEPHLLIGGKTGSGKSVTLFNVLVSLTYSNTPKTLKISLIDPKILSFGDKRILNSPFLNEVPSIGDTPRGLAILKGAYISMMQRYKLMQSKGVKDYRKIGLHAHVIFIDEVYELLTDKSRTEIIMYLVKIASLGRQAGVHLVLATQSVRAETLTGNLLANVSKIGHLVTSRTESQLLGFDDAHKLKGKGDGYKILNNESEYTRFQATYIDIENGSTYQYFRGNIDPNRPTNPQPNIPNIPQEIGVLNGSTTQTDPNQPKPTETKLGINSNLTIYQKILMSGENNDNGQIAPKKQLININSSQQRKLYETTIEKLKKEKKIEFKNGVGYFLTDNKGNR